MNSNEKLTFNYGILFYWKIIIWCILFVGLYDSNFLKPLSPNIEWHFLSTELPIIIPTIIMQLIFVVFYTGILYLILITMMPSHKLIMSDNELLVPDLLKRTYNTIEYKNIVSIESNRNAIYVYGKEKNITIPSLFISPENQEIIFKELNKKINS